MGPVPGCCLGGEPHLNRSSSSPRACFDLLRPGSEVVDWLHRNVEGFLDRREARKYAGNLLKAGYIRHTVNKVTFSEQCYYVFGDVCGGEDRAWWAPGAELVFRLPTLLLHHTCAQTWLPCLCWTEKKLLLHQQEEPMGSRWFCLRVRCGPPSSPTRTLCPTPTAHQEEGEEEGAGTVKVTLSSFTGPLEPRALRRMRSVMSQQEVAAARPPATTRAAA